MLVLGRVAVAARLPLEWIWASRGSFDGWECNDGRRERGSAEEDTPTCDLRMAAGMALRLYNCLMLLSLFV